MLSDSYKKTSALLSSLQPAVRLQILLSLGKTELCVCHLENALGLRQAYLSQHLMALRKAGLISTRRDGRFIFYRLADVRLLDLIYKAVTIAGFSVPLHDPAHETVASCPCPTCQTAGKSTDTVSSTEPILKKPGCDSSAKRSLLGGAS